jgi:hypothetical protein
VACLPVGDHAVGENLGLQSRRLRPAGQNDAADSPFVYWRSVEFMAEIIAVLVLGFLVLVSLVLDLFQRNKQLQSRLHAIENLSEPFASNLAGSVTAVPLRRAIHLNIHLDEAFWRETLQLSPEELEKIQTLVPLHKELSKEGVEQFERWFYADIVIRIQEWRGGYTHIDVRGPLQGRDSIELYPGASSHARLWWLRLPPLTAEVGQDRKGRFAHWRVAFPTLELTLNDSRIWLSAVGGRFGYGRFMDTPAPENIFLWPC